MDAFEEFVRAQGAGLLRCAYLICRDHAAAEDLVQEALARLYPRWSDGDPPSPAYVRKVVLNEYLGRRRRRSSTEIPSIVRDDRTSPDHAGWIDSRDQMSRAISRLPARQRAVLVLRYYEALSDAEIATILGCAEPTVRSLAARAFAELRGDTHLSDFVQEGTGR